MDQFTRRIIGFGVHAGVVDGAALCHMFSQAIARQGLPCYISSEHDPLFEYHRWRANLRVLGVDEVKAVPNVSWSHPFIKRLVETLRREFLDHVLFWNPMDLERKLSEFRAYYNQQRVHASLGGAAPAEASGDCVTEPAELGSFRWQLHCRSLYQLPVVA